MIKYYLTQAGLQNIEKEIKELEGKLKGLQSQTSETVESGGSSGDLTHDNPGFDGLKSQIRVLDDCIRGRYKIVNNSQILNYSNKVDGVCYGSQVTLKMNGQVSTYQIVGYGEADYKCHKIAYDTPLAQAIIGSKANDRKKCEINGCNMEVEIIKVEPLKQSLEGRL